MKRSFVVGDFRPCTNGERGKSVFSAWKKGLFLVLFIGVVAGMFLGVKGAIIESKPEMGTLQVARAIGTMPRPQTGRDSGEAARLIGTLKDARPIGTLKSARPGGQAVEEMDRNGDGKTDIWRYLEDGVLTRSEVDSDYDGKIDFWAYYKDGKTEKQEIDRDNNGIKDAWAYFEEGVKVRQEVDLNHDGKADAWFYYKLGKLCGRAVDSDFDGKIDKVLGEVPRRLKSATP